MAEGKKSFVLYSDQRSLIQLLSDEQAGKLLKHIFAYVNDENPQTDDQLMLLAFEPIKQQFKRDLSKWLTTKEGRSKAGKASAEKRNKLQQESTNPTNVDFVQQESTNPTVNVNVNVNDNVNVIHISPLECEQIVFEINKAFGKNCKAMTRFERQLFTDRINQGYTIDDFLNTIHNLKADDFAKQKNYTFCTPEYISKLETLQKYSVVTKQKQYVSNEDKYAQNVLAEVARLESLKKQNQ